MHFKKLAEFIPANLCESELTSSDGRQVPLQHLFILEVASNRRVGVGGEMLQTEASLKQSIKEKLN